MNILIVSENFTQGGLETHIHTLYKNLGQEHRFIFAFGNYTSDLDIPAQDVHTGFCFRADSTIEQFIQDIQGLVNLIRSESIDVVHVHPFYSFYPAVLAGQLAGVPVAYTFHGPYSVTFSNCVSDTILFRYFYTQALSRIFAVRLDGKAALEEHLVGQEVVFLPNGVDSDLFGRHKVVPNRRWAVVTRLVPDVGKAESLKKLFDLLPELPIDGLDIYGDGIAREELEEYVRQRGMENRIKFMGFYSDLYDRLDGHYSGMIGVDRVAIEGLTMGYPTLAVGYGKICGLYQGKLLEQAMTQNFSLNNLPCCTVEELRTQLEAAYTHPEQFDVRNRVVECFGISTMVQCYITGLEGLSPRPLGNLAEWLSQIQVLPNQTESFYQSPRVFSLMRQYIEFYAMDSETKALFLMGAESHSLRGDLFVFNQTLQQNIITPADQFRTLGNQTGQVLSRLDQILELERQTQTEKAAQAMEYERQLAQATEASVRLERERDTRILENQQLQEMCQHLTSQADLLRAETDGLGKENQLLRAEVDKKAHEMGQVQAENQLLRAEVDKKAHEMGQIQAENQQLEAQLAQLLQEKAQNEQRAAAAESTIRRALTQLWNMSNSKLFRFVHFINRLFKQGFHKEKSQRKAFWRWFRGRFRHVPDRDHSYNPLFGVINILEKSGDSPVLVPATGVPTQATGQLAEHLRVQEKIINQALGSPMSAEAERLRDAIDNRKYKGILIYPHVVFWEPLQTPQQLLRAFAAEGWLCFFCEHPNLPDVCREEEPNLFITHEADLLQAIGDTPVTVLLTWMGSMSFVERIPNKTIWYHILDHLDILLYFDDLYLKFHHAVLETAQLVTYVAKPLKDWTDTRQDAQYLPNGANANEISNIHEGFVPEDMVPIVTTGHKIIGYYGYLAEWMDYDLIRELALRRPEWEFVMVGQAIHDVSSISSLLNVHLLGLKPYKDLSDYAKFFDVATIPFLVDEKMDCVSPIKFYEYLALGKPVVSSKMAELDAFAQRWSFIATADGVDEFLFYLDQFVAPELAEQARVSGPAVAAQNSWLSRAKAVQSKLRPTYLSEDYTKPDVIILSSIDYTFRHQRPQHFAQRLARSGHRVFYVNVNFGSTYAVSQLEENLWQVVLPDSERIAVHLTDCTDDLQVLTNPLEQLLCTYAIRDAVIAVDYPNWVHAAIYLRKKFGFKIVTDYMDDFTGFLNPAEDLVRENCLLLLQESDGVVASSQFLYDIAVRHNPNVTIIRNGTEFNHFHKASQITSTKKDRPIIGYYGAIAEWFNMDVVCRCAQRFPECDIVLVGAVTAERKRLEKYSNIKLIGEVPYLDLPLWLEKFDVCLIPFDTSTDLIKATNPVKFYEYLSAGKKVVATEIPELEPFRNKYVYLENDPNKFCDAVALCLEGKDALSDSEACFAFAAENDWDIRTESFRKALSALYPKISIVVLCYNQLDYTKQCVDSILRYTAYPNYELILVDNCSTDDTAAYLQSLSQVHRQVKIVLNKTNRGFAGGNNDGIAAAEGEYIVLLNNDTLVTRGWLTGMLKHFVNDSRVGLVGPVTNSIGNEARIGVYYTTPEEMPKFALDYTFEHMGEEYPHSGILAMFCLMISRSAYEKIGPLDEAYGIGMFEDDDYSVASERAGFRNVIAEDVFIHHFGSVTFKKMEDKNYMALHTKNRKQFEKKWKVKWHQPKLRPGL